MTQQTTAERMQALIDEMLDRSPSPPGVYTLTASVIAAEIGALTRERDDARAMESHLVKLHLNAVAERDGARAEVERLRPAAEAYAAQVKWEASEGGTMEEIKAAWIEYRRAADYARAAKGQA